MFSEVLYLVCVCVCVGEDLQRRLCDGETAGSGGHILPEEGGLQQARPALRLLYPSQSNKHTQMKHLNHFHIEKRC